MPELDILHGFEFASLQLKERWKALHPGLGPMQASVQIFPMVFAVGTQKKSYTTCTVDQREVFDYTEDLEPVPEGFSANPFDQSKAKGTPFESFLKPHLPGELFVKARGKEIVFAAGHHLIRAHFGLEGTMVIVKTEDYEKMIAHDCPGNNKNKTKAAQMRSFVVPEHLTVPGTRDKSYQSMAIFAAIIGEEHTILLVDHNRLLRLHIMSRKQPWTAEDLDPASAIWPFLWSDNHGPDWIYERARAEEKLDEWRQSVLARGLDNASLVHVICALQEYFNGYGQHTAHDLLHTLGLWPAIPPFLVCSNDILFDRLKTNLYTYAVQFISDTYRRRCLCQPNQDSPLAFNYTSNDNYLNQYLQVFRKSALYMPSEQYNMFLAAGLFDRSHTIGEPYVAKPEDFKQTGYTKVGVRQFTQGKQPIYSVIVARRPASWRYSGEDVVEKVAPDAREAGFGTTLGPASFHMFKENQHTWDTAGQPGRKATVYTGKPGRPAKSAPRIADLRYRARRGAAAHAAAEALALQDEDAPRAKRVRLSRASERALVPTTRTTRSRSQTSTSSSVLDDPNLETIDSDDDIPPVASSSSMTLDHEVKQEEIDSDEELFA